MARKGLQSKSKFTFHGKQLEANDYVVRKDNVIHMPVKDGQEREKIEFPSINQAKKKSFELMCQGKQVRTFF